MRRYLQTFFRHPILLSAPIIIALCVAVAYQTRQPRQFLAGSTLWCDVPVPNDSSIFSGYLRPVDAVRLGYLDGDDPAVEALGAMLSGPDPWCPFFF